MLHLAPAQRKTLLLASQCGLSRLPSPILPNRTSRFPQRPAEAADTDFIAQPSVALSEPHGHFAALVISQTH